MISATCPRFEVFLSNVRADVRAYVLLPSFRQCAPSTGHDDLPVSVHICLLLPVRRLSGPRLARSGAESTGWTGVNERTFIAVKPDGVQRRLVGEIVRRFERRGFKLVGLKLVQASESLLKDHYWDLRTKPFFRDLMSYMSSGPVVAMVWEGLDVVKTARKMLGETNPADSLPGTIRGDYCVEVGRNVIHGSDSVESAQKEISLWFRQNELHCWEDNSSHWIYN
ncbi:nucleoside diphosphate kinase 3 isoform X1 [Sparus aurata]|uniref:Nucleoside diphosphate kinase n=1 Tax=Sparus aurata TaxID=8175 RepID=A0A671UE57_SPAAU|nr:nucleoside diphosphate kinase 3 isoform X1 [Sparus aurata]